MSTTAQKQRGLCKALNKRGEPCQAIPVSGSEFCFWHAPEKAKERAEARSRGGRARHGRKIGNPGHDGSEVTIERASDVVPVLARTVNDLFRLENSISRARAIAYVCTAALKAFEITELQGRVEALETALQRRG